MTTQSDTPRTNAEASDGWSGDAEAVSVCFARQLEQELAAADARIAELEIRLDEAHGAHSETVRVANEEMDRQIKQLAEMTASRDAWCEDALLRARGIRITGKDDIDIHSAAALLSELEKYAETPSSEQCDICLADPPGFYNCAGRGLPGEPACRYIKRLEAKLASMNEPKTPNNNEVICPNCAHQFRAIPVNVQNELAAAKAELATVRNETIEECWRIADNADHAYRVSDAIRALKDKP